MSRQSGVELIGAERARHPGLGYTLEHDAQHTGSELAGAAIAFAAASDPFTLDPDGDVADVYWPWDAGSWKPSSDPRRNLVKAGALIAAELDRLEAAREHDDDSP